MSERTPARAITNQPTRTIDVVWFNYPTFLASVGVVVIAVLLLVVAELPSIVRLGMAVGAAIATWWLLASTAVAAWVFEISGVTRWRWVPGALAAPTSWLNITTGFDDTTPVLTKLLTPASGTAIDLFDAGTQHGGSIRRARASRPPLGPSIAPGQPLPFVSGSFDAAFMLMAAHELRDPSLRTQLFREVARVLAPAGQLVVVEHLRSPLNALAFGPGVFHFFPRATWINAAASAGLELVDERQLTRFANALVFRQEG